MELSIYYPDVFQKNGNVNQNVLRIGRMNAILDEIEGLTDTETAQKEVYNFEKELLSLDKPNIWNVHEEGNMERVLEVDFHKFGVSVAEMTGINLENTSTFTFYASVELLKERAKPNTNG